MKKELVDLKIDGRIDEFANDSRALVLDMLRKDLQLTNSKRKLAGQS